VKVSYCKLFDSPLGNERPLFCDLSFTLDGVTVFIEINKDNTYSSFSYKIEQPGPLGPLLSLLSEFLPGRNLFDFSSLSWNFFDSYWREDSDYLKAFPITNRPFTPFPFLLISRGLQEYFGTPSRDQLQNQDYKNLVCKCFGVYRSEIEREWIENQQASASGITQRLKAGACCGSCLPTIKDVLSEAWNTLGHQVLNSEQDQEELLNGKSPRYNGHTQVDFLFYLEQLLEEWKRSREDMDHQFFLYEIQDLEFYNLKLKILTGPWVEEDSFNLQNELESYLFEKSRVKLNLEFTTEAVPNLQ
jgi:bacterioferritin-associated ferredoxin